MAYALEQIEDFSLKRETERYRKKLEVTLVNKVFATVNICID